MFRLGARADLADPGSSLRMHLMSAGTISTSGYKEDLHNPNNPITRLLPFSRYRGYPVHSLSP